MEDKKLTEKESIELISRMIKQSSNHLDKGSGNIFLVWGYVCAAVSMLVYGVLSFTLNPLYSLLYLLIPVVGGIVQAIVYKRTDRSDGRVESFASYVIGKTWNTLSPIFFIAMVPCVYYMFSSNHSIAWIALFVLGLMLPGIGTTITGHVLKKKVLIFGGYIGIVIGVIVLCESMINPTFGVVWCLIFAVTYVFMMIIPGHYLNMIPDKRK